MSSSTLMRLLMAKRVNHSLISRQLSTLSTNGFKRDSQKLLSIDIFNAKPKTLTREEMPNQLVASRWTSSTAVGHQNSGHNHSKLWTIERYLSIGLLAVIPASFVVPVPAMDYLLALSLVTHIHWGVEAIVIDYIRPQIFGKLVPKLALIYVYVLSVMALSGLFYFNYTDVGLVQAIRMITKL